MADIKKGKYYKATNSDAIIVLATRNSKHGNGFSGKLIVDPNNNYPNDLNKVITSWNSHVFMEIDYIINSNDLFPIY